MRPVQTLRDPQVGAPAGEPAMVLPVSGPGGPVDILGGGASGQFPPVSPLGPGGPVVYPVGQPPDDPAATPPVTVAPVTPTPDPSEPPLITPVDPEDQPTPIDPDEPPPVFPVEPLDPSHPELPVGPLDPRLPPIPSPPGPVPEPSGWMLMILGAGLSGAALRRRAQYGRPHAG